MDELTATIGDYQGFLKNILGMVSEAGFDMHDFVQLDHMGYRTTSLEQYKAKKAELETINTLLGETIVNDRPIAIFRLQKPVMFDAWRVDAIELLAPKPSRPLPEGLDHIEFVLYDDKETFLQKYKDKEFVLVAADRGINPEIAYRLPDNKTVKFHLLSLTTVVYLEHKLGIKEVNNP